MRAAILLPVDGARRGLTIAEVFHAEGSMEPKIRIELTTYSLRISSFLY